MGVQSELARSVQALVADGWSVVNRRRELESNHVVLCLHHAGFGELVDLRVPLGQWQGLELELAHMRMGR